jgi:hypothetical protein
MQGFRDEEPTVVFFGTQVVPEVQYRNYGGSILPSFQLLSTGFVTAMDSPSHLAASELNWCLVP